MKKKTYSAYLQLKIAPSMLEKLQSIAEAKGLTVSDLVRSLILIMIENNDLPPTLQ